MLRRLGGAALLGALAYTTHDAAADSAMYWRCKRMVMDAAAQHPRFAEEVGSPFAGGPWYNSSVAISHDGHMATVTLPLRGSRRASDVTVRVVRKGGLRSTLLFNLVGGGEWEVLVMNALIGMGPGGVPRSMSLLQPEEPDAAAAEAAVAAMGHVHHKLPARGAAGAAGQTQTQRAAAAAAAGGGQARA